MTVSDFQRQMHVVVLLKSGFASGVVYSVMRRGEGNCVVEIDGGGAVSNTIRVNVKPSHLIPYDTFLRSFLANET